MIEKLLNFNKVLCLSPHPDDVELSMGATILKCKYTQFDILYMSYGTKTDITSSKERILESQNFWKNIPNVTILNNDIKYISNLDMDDWITLIENKYDISKYDAIFSTPINDSHYEHIFASGLLYPLCRTNAISIIEYKGISTLDGWVPNMFVDISQFIDQKIKMLKSNILSQNDKIYFTDSMIRNFHINYGCLKRNIQYVEQFKINLIF